MKKIISLEQVHKIYRTEEIETVALENVNLQVDEGEFLAVMGPSGCGKSTLLNVMGLLDNPTSGRVILNGIETDKMKDKDLAKFRNENLGFVFQSFHLINSLNVIDNVELPLLYRKVSASERHRLAKEVLEKVGLSTVCATSLHSSRVVSVSVWPSLVPSSATPRSSLPMSLRVISTRRWGLRSWAFSISSTRKMAVPSSW